MSSGAGYRFALSRRRLDTGDRYGARGQPALSRELRENLITFSPNILRLARDLDSPDTSKQVLGKSELRDDGGPKRTQKAGFQTQPTSTECDRCHQAAGVAEQQALWCLISRMSLLEVSDQAEGTSTPSADQHLDLCIVHIDNARNI